MRLERSNGSTDVSLPEHLSNSPAYAAPSPEEYALADQEPPHVASLTELAAESLRTGIAPQELLEEIPSEDARLRSGDPDVDPLDNEYSGEEIPGGSNPTPDQNNVDDIGRAYGISELESGTLRSAEEILEKRDARPWEAERKDPS
jgi:hypothetical protein